MSYDLNDNDFNPLFDFALNEPVADKKPNKVPVAFRVPQDIKDWMEGYAIYEGCYDISQFMNKLIKDKMDVVNGLAEPDYMKSEEKSIIEKSKLKSIPELIFIQIVFFIFLIYSYFFVSFIFWDLNPLNWNVYGRLILLFLYLIQKVVFIFKKDEIIKYG
jgi:hypothetical protein